jgi:hypothetical protein
MMGLNHCGGSGSACLMLASAAGLLPTIRLVSSFSAAAMG